MFGCIYLLCVLLYQCCPAWQMLVWFCCSAMTATVINEHYIVVQSNQVKMSWHTSGRTGSSIPTTQMHVKFEMMASSWSQSGSDVISSSFTSEAPALSKTTLQSVFYSLFSDLFTSLHRSLVPLRDLISYTATRLIHWAWNDDRLKTDMQPVIGKS